MTLEESIDIDKFKDEQAKIHNIQVIRINCNPSEFNVIKSNIMSSKLTDYFDFKNVDFLEIDKKASSSRILQACKLYNSGIHDLNEIANIIGVSKSSVYNYIVKCDELGICTYNRKEQQLEKAHVNSGTYQPRKVVCLNTGEVFESTCKAEEKYNIKNISMCCMGKREYAGIDPITYTPLVWAYHEDYLKMSKEEIAKKKD